MEERKHLQAEDEVELERKHLQTELNYLARKLCQCENAQQAKNLLRQKVELHAKLEELEG